MQFDRAKLRAAISYACENSDPAKLSTTNLNKVLYFTDMLHYLRVGIPATGATYTKSRTGTGPACAELLPVLKDLSSEGVIDFREPSFVRHRKSRHGSRPP